MISASSPSRRGTTGATARDGPSPGPGTVRAGGEQRDLLARDQLLQPGGITGPDDDVRRARIDDRVPQRGVGEQVVERHGHPARLPDAEQRRHVLQGVGEEDAHPVARGEAVGPQVRGEPGGGVGEVGVADLVVVEAHRHLACVIGGDAPQRGRDVHPGSSTTASAWPLSTWSPGCTCSAVSTPSSGAATVCSIFIASSTTSGCPAATCRAHRRRHAHYRPGHRREQGTCVGEGVRVREAGHPGERAGARGVIDVHRGVGLVNGEGPPHPVHVQHDAVRRCRHQRDRQRLAVDDDLDAVAPGPVGDLDLLPVHRVAHALGVGGDVAPARRERALAARRLRQRSRRRP